MRTTDLLRLSSRQIVRKRRRYRGPFLGIVLGIASIVTVVTIGDVILRSLGSNLAMLGSATLIKANLNLVSYEYPEDTKFFSMADIEDLRRLPAVKAVAPSVYSWWPIKLDFTAFYRSKEYKSARIMGVDRSFFQMTSYLPIAKGRAFTESEVKHARNVAVIGRSVKEFLFGEDDAVLGEVLLTGTEYVKIVGILGSADNRLYDEVIFLPISVATKKIPGMSSIRRLTVLPEDVYNVERVHREVSRILSKRKNGDGGCEVMFDRARVELVRGVLEVFRLILYVGIVAVLIVSSGGVANVMSALVRERIPEIGLRKAVGATHKDITEQFLFESVMIGVIGTVLGIGLGSAVVFTTSAVIFDHTVNRDMYFLSLVISCAAGLVVGMVSGVLPAKTAAKLDPVEALRFE